MLDREPFLKAIFAEPGSDLPRLVFADWLDDRDEHEWAAHIRHECQAARGTTVPDPEEVRWTDAGIPTVVGAHHGFLTDPTIVLPADALSHPDAFRLLACRDNPHWYGATALFVASGRIADPAQVETLLRSPVTEYVSRLDLSGREEHLGHDRDDALGLGLVDFVYRPAITTRMVEHLCGMREARRLVALDLSRNELDNDAVRALVRSTSLIRLKELSIQEGNTRVKGKLWGELQARFPEAVS